MTAFRERVLEVLRALPPGAVVSYGDVAREAGRPAAARAVGNVLRDVDGLPWWRVVASDGRLVPGLEPEQARRLAAEGVELTPQGRPRRRRGGPGPAPGPGGTPRRS